MPHPASHVVITGASAGLGAAFARAFAARGANVALVARRADRLQALADDLIGTHGVRAAAVPLDLAQPDAPQRLRSALDARGFTPDALINNAGFGTAGPFADEDPARLRDELLLNVVALTALTREFLPTLLASGHGLLVNVASTAAFQPLAGAATYAASKAYVKSLTEALWVETRGTGTRVLALCPGPTETEFFEVAGDDRFKVGASDTPETVITAALAAIDRPHSGPTTIVGKRRALTAHANRWVPTRVSLAVAARATKWGTA